MKLRKYLHASATAAFGLASVLGMISAEAVAANLAVDCRPGAPFQPIVLPNAAVRSDITGICLLCAVDDALAVIDNRSGNYARLSTVAGVASTVSLTVTDTSTRYVAKPIKPRHIGFVVRSPDQLLSLKLLTGAKITTSLNGVDRQGFTVGGPLGLDLVGLLNSQDYFVLGAAATQDFDAVRITLGSGVRLLTSLRVYGACVQS